MPLKVNNKLFDGQSFYIGIDCHKKSWNVTILGEHYEHKTYSQNPDPQLLSNYLHRNFPGGTFHSVYEAGFNGFTTCRALHEEGINCIITNPADIPTSQKERENKNDKVDSRKLARTLRGNGLFAIHIPDEQLEADRALVRQRYNLSRDVSRIKQQIKSKLFQFGIDIPGQFTLNQSKHWSKAYINWLKELDIDQPSLKQALDNFIEIGLILKEKLQKVSKQILELAQTDRYKRNFELLQTIPGIGQISAMYLLVQLGDISRFKRLDQLCNYIGLVPRTNSSGENIRASKMVKRGNKKLKILMIEVSWVAIRKDPALMLIFNELSKRMHKNKAIIRIARRMLARIRFVLLHQQEYKMNII